MTYSIVAVDRATGQMGAAVQSHFLAVGSLCPAVRAGVGAVCSQSMVEPAHRRRILDHLSEGADATRALETSLALDDGAASSQIGVVDAAGRAAAHTGSACIAEAGHVTGDAFACQANMMTNTGVTEAMAAAYEAAASDGLPFALRLLAALDAAEGAGGDIRGRQSAALLVYGPDPSAFGDGVTIDVRVDDHADPLGELRRLHTMRAAVAAPTPEAVRQFHAVGRGNPELLFWTGIAAAAEGRLDEARPLVAEAIATHDGWADLVRRLPAVGRLDASLVDALLDG